MFGRYGKESILNVLLNLYSANKVVIRHVQDTINADCLAAYHKNPTSDTINMAIDSRITCTHSNICYDRSDQYGVDCGKLICKFNQICLPLELVRMIEHCVL